MKNIKRIGALVLALAMLFALTGTAFATGEEELGQDPSLNSTVTGPISNAGVKQDWDATNQKYNALEPTVRIDKEIIIFNTRTDNTIVYLPNVKFNYTIAVADVTDGTPEIKDEFSYSAKVKDGVANALSTSSADVTYSNTNGITTGSTTINGTTYVTTNSSGVAAAGYFDITFIPANFGSAGIYRYSITEAEDSTLTRAKAGVTNANGTYNSVRYLDVYVRNNEAGTGLEIYGYVLFENSSVDKSFDATGTLPIEAKTNGFVSDKNDGASSYSSTETDVDLYLTSNVKIQKNVDGALGDKNNEFPFAATIANATIVSNPIISYQVINDTATLNTANTSNATKTMSSGTATIGAATVAGADNFKLDDGDYIYIYGIPGNNVASTVTASEYNNTFDTYIVAATYDSTDVNLSDNNEANTTPVHTDSTQVASLSAAQIIDITKTEDVLEVTNTLNTVSPTGVIMRVAPYMLIMAVGAALVIILAIRRRKEEEA